MWEFCGLTPSAPDFNGRTYVCPINAFLVVFGPAILPELNRTYVVRPDSSSLTFMRQQPSLFNQDDDAANDESLNNMKYWQIYLKQILGSRRRSGNITVRKYGRFGPF